MSLNDQSGRRLSSLISRFQTSGATPAKTTTFRPKQETGFEARYRNVSTPKSDDPLNISSPLERAGSSKAEVSPVNKSPDFPVTHKDLVHDWVDKNTTPSTEVETKAIMMKGKPALKINIGLPVAKDISPDVKKLKIAVAKEISPVSKVLPAIAKQISPALVTKGKQISPAIVTDAKQISPALVMKGKQISSAIVTDAKQISPASVTEANQISPASVTKSKQISPALVTVTKQISPASVTVTKQLSPASVTVTRQISPASVTEAKQISPALVTEAKKISPASVTEAKQISPASHAGSKEISPASEADAKEIRSALKVLTTVANETSLSSIAMTTVAMETSTASDAIATIQPTSAPIEPKTLMVSKDGRSLLLEVDTCITAAEEDARDTEAEAAEQQRAHEEEERDVDYDDIADFDVDVLSDDSAEEELPTLQEIYQRCQMIRKRRFYQDLHNVWQKKLESDEKEQAMAILSACGFGRIDPDDIGAGLDTALSLVPDRFWCHDSSARDISIDDLKMIVEEKKDAEERAQFREVYQATGAAEGNSAPTGNNTRRRAAIATGGGGKSSAILHNFLKMNMLKSHVPMYYFQSYLHRFRSATERESEAAVSEEDTGSD